MLLVAFAGAVGCMLIGCLVAGSIWWPGTVPGTDRVATFTSRALRVVLAILFAGVGRMLLAPWSPWFDLAAFVIGAVGALAVFPTLMAFLSRVGSRLGRYLLTTPTTPGRVARWLVRLAQDPRQPGSVDMTRRNGPTSGGGTAVGETGSHR